MKDKKRREGSNKNKGTEGLKESGGTEEGLKERQRTEEKDGRRRETQIEITKEGEEKG